MANGFSSAGPTNPDVLLPRVIAEEFLQIYPMAAGSSKSTAYGKLKTRLGSNRIGANPAAAAAAMELHHGWVGFVLPAVRTQPGGNPAWKSWNGLGWKV